MHIELDLDFELGQRFLNLKKNVLKPKLKGLEIERIGLSLLVKNLKPDFALSN